MSNYYITVSGDAEDPLFQEVADSTEAEDLLLLSSEEPCYNSLLDYT